MALDAVLRSRANSVRCPDRDCQRRRDDGKLARAKHEGGDLSASAGDRGQHARRSRRLSRWTWHDRQRGLCVNADETGPDAICQIGFPADEGAGLPSAAGLEAYDGVFITGSALNLYDGGAAITRQIDLARAVFASRTPLFGSCWGLQVATAAAGGEVLRNPKGREIGVARNIWPTAAGRAHPLLAGRRAAYDAICSHLDIVTPAPGALVLAANATSAIQAAEIGWEGGTFWGVQYHPEYSLREIAAIVARRAGDLTREGFFPDERSALAYVEDLRVLDAAPDRRDVAGGWGSATTSWTR